MKITEKDVTYVAALANLELTAQETSKFTSDMDSILAYVEKLNEVDTSSIEPMAQVLYDEQEAGAGGGTLRADEERPSLPRELSLSNAPESVAGQFKVPKVIER